MKLPVPQGQYSRLSETERNRQIEAADMQNYKRNQDVELVANRLILRSPDGTRWSVTVDNAGLLTATAI